MTEQRYKSTKGEREYGARKKVQKARVKRGGGDSKNKSYDRIKKKKMIFEKKNMIIELSLNTIRLKARKLRNQARLCEKKTVFSLELKWTLLSLCGCWSGCRDANDSTDSQSLSFLCNQAVVISKLQYRNTGEDVVEKSGHKGRGDESGTAPTKLLNCRYYVSARDGRPLKVPYHLKFTSAMLPNNDMLPVACQ